MARKDQYKRIIDESIAQNDDALDAAVNEVHENVVDQITANAAELSQATGEINGRIDNMMDESDAAIYKPVLKMDAGVQDVISQNNIDLRQSGYEPKLFYADVQAALAAPNGLQVLQDAIQQATAAATNGATPNNDACIDNPSLPGCTFNIPMPTPVVPPAPGGGVTPGNCFPAGALDPLNPNRLICGKGGDNPGGTLESSPPTIPPPVDGATCPAPEINMPACPAPIIVMQPPRNPADLQPGECSPGDPDCQPQPPECPDVPDVNVNNVVNVPPLKFPDPKEPEKFKFRVLDPGVDGGVAVKWDADVGCDTANDLNENWRAIIQGVHGPLQDVADFAAVGFGGWVSNKLGISQRNGVAVASLAFSLFSEAENGSEEAFTVRAQAAAFSAVRLLYPAVEQRLGTECATALGPFTAAAALVEGMQDLGLDFTYFVQPWIYEAQYLCPVLIPTQTSIDDLWLGERITDEQHICYTRAHGNLPNLHRMAAEEKRERLRIDEWIDLWRRGKVDFDRVQREARKLGWLEKDAVARKADLTEAIPPFSDVIRMMVRDVENPDAVRDGGLDIDFEKNFQGILREYANANGITEDIARRYWRAHWQWPSNTQLYEMIHRLRPGEVPNELVTTKEMARRVLQTNDVAPEFVDRLIALSYHPLTRVDVRRAYEIGVLKREDVKRAYLDLGYDETNAETLTRFTEVQYAQKQAAKSKVWSLSGIASAYQTGSIDRSFAFAKAKVFLGTDELAASFLADVDQKRESVKRAACIKGLKKRYMMGELDDLRVSDELYGYVGDRDGANTIMNAWRCERDSRRKEIPAATLCNWFYKGIINQDQYITRLLNLGYTMDDATRMIASCGQDVIEKLKAKAVKEQKDILTRIKQQQDQAKARLKEMEAAYKKACEAAKKINPDIVCP